MEEWCLHLDRHQRGSHLGRHHVHTWTGRGDGQKYEWYATASDGNTAGTGVTRSFETALGTDPILVGAGDVAVCGSTGDEQTADILLGVQGGVYTLGDNVYDNGLLTEFNNCYTPSWGQTPIKARTRPISGNHDFGNGANNGGGYFDYFNGIGVNDGPAGPRNTGFYSYDVGSFWHVVALNTECANAGVGCTAGSPQEIWLKNDLAANASKNVIVRSTAPTSPPASVAATAPSHRSGRTSTTTASISSWPDTTITTRSSTG